MLPRRCTRPAGRPGGGRGQAIRPETRGPAPTRPPVGRRIRNTPGDNDDADHETPRFAACPVRRRVRAGCRRRRGADRGRHLQPRRGSHPPAELRGLPPARRDGADGPDELRAGATLGPRHPHQGGRAVHAALASRQDRRHPAVRERHLAERRRGRHHRAVGRRRRPAGQPRRPAPARRLARDRRVAPRRPLRPPARPRGQLRALDPERRGAGPVVAADPRDRPDRGPLGDGHRGAAVGAACHPPLGRLPAAGGAAGRPRGGGGRPGPRQLSHRVRGRQDRRRVPREHRQADEGGVAHRLRQPLPLGGRGARRFDRGGHLVPPEGLRAQVPGLRRRPGGPPGPWTPSTSPPAG